jgi:hypothetical protein
VRKLNREEFLRVRRTSPEAHDVARHRGGVALCFGRQVPEQPGEYLDLDLISMAIVDQLTRFFEHRKDAAECVCVHWPQWLITLAQAEGARRHDFIFYVGGHPDRNWVAQGLVIRGGAFNEIVREVAAMPPERRPTHAFYVDLWRTAGQVRAAAAETGVALDDRFFYALEDPRCEAKIFEELRAHNTRLVRVHRAGSPRAAKATAPAAAEVRAFFDQARQTLATLQ